MEIHHVPVTRTARVAVLGGEEAGSGPGGTSGGGGDVWTVLHGYRQLAPRFLRRFRGIASPQRRILAPEGLSRFYLASPEGVRDASGTVGASWMTREDRDAEIVDYVGYLDAVTGELGGTGHHTVLGFSQGAHTAARWAVRGTSRIHRLVLWGAAFPRDLPEDMPAGAAHRLEGVELVLVRGATDPLRDPAEEAREEAWLEGAGLAYWVEMHPGGHEIDPSVLEALAEPRRGGATASAMPSPPLPCPCPLCAHPETAPAASTGGRTGGRAGGRELRDCPVCGLLFAGPGERLDAEEERARYETHKNDPGDLQYRAFLDQLARPLGERLLPGARGLDYGSGPGPTLSLMMTERGFPTADWDPFFAPDPAPLRAGPYDFVTCTETVEHFFEPGREFQRLAGLIRPGGWLGIMTDPVPVEGVPPNWYYLRDPTHVAFYRERTLDWIAARFGWEMERPERRVILYRTGASDLVRPGSS